jgi:hypothetical protein
VCFKEHAVCVPVVVLGVVVQFFEVFFTQALELCKQFNELLHKLLLER